MDLPNSKDELPKCLYLDQNKWIDLSKVHYGRSNDPAHKDALSAIREAVAGGRLIVPFSCVTIAETLASNNQEQRRRLAEFMVDLSQNHSILPEHCVRPLEIRNALLQKMGRFPDRLIRPILIQRGLFSAMGLEVSFSNCSPQCEQLLRENIVSTSTTVELLVQGADRDRTATARQRDIQATMPAESARRLSAVDLDSRTRDRVALVDLALNGPVIRELRDTLAELGVRVENLPTIFTGHEDYIPFFHSIPTFDIEVSLIQERDRNLERAIHRNDAKDLVFLSVAIPYCNIIVLEKFWAQMVRSTRLDRKYDTAVMSDLGSLRQCLTSLACL